MTLYPFPSHLPTAVWGHKSAPEETVVFSALTLELSQRPTAAAGPFGQGKEQDLLSEQFDNVPVGKAGKGENRDSVADLRDMAADDSVERDYWGTKVHISAF